MSRPLNAGIEPPRISGKGTAVDGPMPLDQEEQPP